MANKTEYQKLQARAKKLDIPANQSADDLQKAIEQAEAKGSTGKTPKQGTKTQRKNAAKGSRGSSDQTRKSEEGPPVDEHGGVDPEWHNDPERVLGLDVLEAREGMGKGKGKVEVQTFTPLAHHELTIDFTELPPNTDFEVRITGPIASPYWGTLKSDDWGQAQLIWRTAAGGEYEVSAKGPGVDAKGEFTVASYDADAEYRSAKRARRGKGSEEETEATGSVATVEEPGTMGDTSSTEAKNQPTEEELANPAQTDPAFTPSGPRPADADEGLASTGPAMEPEPSPAAGDGENAAPAADDTAADKAEEEK